ncbi:phage tail tip lysozyme, partial [Streptococcus pneumoniae]|uniref:phage tail tip lysozyme n=1 Tax=Streptococcus pneumoniae TaxID=1313 RepID=UPI0019506EF2
DISNMIPADVGDKIGGGISRSLEWLGVKDAVDDLLGLTSKAPAGGSKTLDPMAFFQSMGWSKEQAAGIVANLQRESNMNPRAVGDNGKAVGIAQ